MDHAIGEVISAVKDDGTFEDTLIIITSDHGERRGQHYDTSWGHNSLHETVTHIPLMIRYLKKLPKDVRIKGFGQQVDLLPTILDLVGMETDVLEIDGKSLLPLLENTNVKDPFFMEHSSIQRAVRGGRWKFINDMMRGAFELCDVLNGPFETRNLVEAQKERAEELEMMLTNSVDASLLADSGL